MNCFNLASILIILLLNVSCSSLQNQEKVHFEGKIFNVNTDSKSFDLLKKTEYDPSTNEGKSRYNVKWTENTKFIEGIQRENFDGIAGTYWVDFHPGNSKRTDHMKSGASFKVWDVSIYGYNAKRENLPNGPKNFICRFTPKTATSGIMHLDGKDVKIELNERRANVKTFVNTDSKDLAKGLWRGSISGMMSNNEVTAKTVILEPMPDPRKTDDPNLPRVLVIGDSISMNYHDSAKKALAGIANYHRITENGGPSNRGVESVDLWLGNYPQKGLHWDVIQFNHGLHDLKQAYDAENKKFGAHQVEPEDYKKNLKAVIKSLKKSGAVIIWCETTPVPKTNLGTYTRRKGESAVYNQLALEALKDHPDILINNIHKSITGSALFDQWRTGNDVHFHKQNEKEFIGQKIAAVIKQALESKAKK